MIRRVLNFLLSPMRPAVSWTADRLMSGLGFLTDHAGEIALAVALTGLITLAVVGISTINRKDEARHEAQKAVASKSPPQYRDDRLLSTLHVDPNSDYIRFETTIIKVDGHRFLVAINAHGIAMIQLPDEPSDKDKKERE